MSTPIIDARGLSCPEPVLLTKQAIEANVQGGFSVAVTSATARDNVAALLQSKGFVPAIQENHGEWHISAQKK